jgi:hypothetical protein
MKTNFDYLQLYKNFAIKEGMLEFSKEDMNWFKDTTKVTVDMLEVAESLI